MKKIICLTYQTFPAETANSLQTVSNIKYLVKNKVEVELMFPLRSKKSNADINVIKKYYSIDEKFISTGIKHYLPFGKIDLFNSFLFNMSHFLWAWYVVNFKITPSPDVSYITRSDWILYFLAKKGKEVLFECHKTSRIRNFIIKKVRDFKNVKIVLINHNLQDFYGLHKKNSTVLHNAVDEEVFQMNNHKTKKGSNEIIFAGNLSRFNEQRGINFLIDAFNESNYLKTYKLIIIGGPENEANKLRKYVHNLDLDGSVEILGRVDRTNIGKIYERAKIGILINTSSDSSSYRYTSPLKYFEYVYSGLNTIAVDFPSHRVLPGSKDIIFFEENNFDSFESAVKNATSLISDNSKLINEITLDTRAKNIIKLIG